MNKNIVQKKRRALVRKNRVRKLTRGSGTRPRLTVFASNKHIFAQIIDDLSGKTILAGSDLNSKANSKIESASEVGRELAKRAAAKDIKKVVFDRGSKLYNGRVKALAEAVREEGIEF